MRRCSGPSARLSGRALSSSLLGGVLLVGGALLAPACGGGAPDISPAAAPTSTSTPLPTPTPTPVPPEVVLARSGKAMEGLRSFRFRLEHESGATQLMPGLSILEVEGAVVSPDKLTVRFSGRAGRLPVRSDLITIGPTTYMTNPLSGKWETLQVDVSPLGFFDPQKGIAAMLATVREPSVVSGPRGPTFRLVGKVEAEALTPLLGMTIEGALANVELSIDAGSYHLLIARIAGRVMPSDVEEVVRVVTLSDFDEGIIIKPPQ